MDKFYSTAEAATLAGLKLVTFNQRARRNEIKPADFAKNGKKARWTMAQIEQIKNLRGNSRTQPPVVEDKKNNADTDGEKTSEQNNHAQDTTTTAIKQQPFSQHLENLPREILALPRFVKTRKDNPKAPSGAKWQDPKNQKLYSELKGTIGFVAATDTEESLLFLDCDHFRDANGNFVSDAAKRWFNLITADGKYFAELSQSKKGAHVFAKPTKGKFGKITGRIYLTDDKQSFIEVFYHTTKFCLVTGDLFCCKPNAPIAQGNDADNIMHEIIAELAKQKHVEETIPKQSAREQEPKKTAADLGNDYDLFRADIMLDVINPADLPDSDWLAVISSCKNIGIPYHVVDAFNHRDNNRYNEQENLERWNSATDPSFNIETLHGIAKRFGYSEADARREWYQLHPEKSKRRNRNEPAQVTNPNDIYAQIRRQCKWSHDKNGNPTKIKSDVFNYKLIFEQDPNLHGLFGRDNFRQETIFLKRAPWHEKYLQLKDSWDDADDAELRLYLAEHYAEMGTPQRTLDFVIRVARENSFHAIRNFFESLPKWDGVERADNIFIKFLGAEDSRYTREITRHFLFGAIARALYPGCDFQSVVILQGAQGIGKSRLLRMLGGKHGVNPKGDSWHIALRDQLDDSHAVDAMRKGWIVEIEEFAAASRADVNSMKGVLSADDVTRRFAYDRHAKTIKAHWIFAATCNDDAPLRDQTGNRRFLPIKCHNKESTIVEGMDAEYIRQVWSEAYHKFKEMFQTAEDFDADKLRLTPDFQAQAAKFAEGITQDDGLTTEIKGFIDHKIPPLIIWYLLSKEERRKFFVDGGKITIEKADLQARFKNMAGRRYDELKPVFDAACKVKDGYVRELTDKNDRWCYAFYGNELREHICTSEIFNECFGADNRKRITRISEILSQLAGWQLGSRLRNADPVYPDQTKPYYRNNG